MTNLASVCRSERRVSAAWTRTPNLAVGADYQLQPSMNSHRASRPETGQPARRAEPLRVGSAEMALWLHFQCACQKPSEELPRQKPGTEARSVAASCPTIAANIRA